MFTLRFNHAIGILAIAGLLFAGCSKPESDTPTPPPGPSTVAVTGVSVGSASLSLTEGGSATISYTVSPSNATNTGVSFKSSDSSVASVDSNGKVTAGKPGTATITVTTADGGKTATCTVTVTAKTVAVTGVKLDKSTLTIEEGASEKLTATVEPSNATNTDVTWKSSNEAIAKVGTDGTVTGVKAGEATITVTTKDGGKTATCKVTVKAAGVAVTGVSLNKNTLSLGEGDTFQLVPTIKPDNATNKEVTWKSNNTAVATVSDDGLVTAVKAGTTTISCTTKDGNKKANCSVTVKAPVAVTGVKLDKTTLTVEIGTPQKLTATVSPSNATNKEIEWKSSNESIATVAEDGTVTGIKAGEATITVTTADGGKTATCKVTVKAPTVAVTGVTLNKSTLTITAGETFKLVPTIKPDNATNKEVEWKTSNSAIATVAEDGTVTGVKAGNATITCTTKDGSKKATCSVTVKAATVAVTGVTLNKTSLTITTGETFKLVPTVKPDNASNKQVEWKTSNSAIATVAEDGTVTGVKAGTATITCTTKDGSKKATCSVTVKAPAVSGVELDKTTLTMNVGGTYTLKATVKPEGATNKNVTWTTSDASVATVTNGKVTAVKKGTATITVKTADGGYTKTCTVTVKDFRWFYTQGGGSSTSLGAGGANPDPYTFTYVMGSNSGTLGDAMEFTLSPSVTDTDESHWNFTVVSNDGCITLTKVKLSSSYKAKVTFKKNGKARIRLSYTGSDFSLTQDVIFNVYLDGSGKWKFQYFVGDGAYKDYPGGNLTAKLSDKYFGFRVVNVSGSTISDPDASHYRIYDWWPDAKVISTSINPQTAHGNNWCIMWAYFEKVDYTYVELSYTDGTYMLACEHFRITVTN